MSMPYFSLPYRRLLAVPVCLWLFCVLAVTPLGAQPPDTLIELTILHTNDMHAVYGGTTSDGDPCYEALCPGGEGGVARLLREVTAVRAQKPDTLLLNAGDQFTGTLFHSRYKGAQAGAVLDFLGFDATVPGNHEFDNGCTGFAEFVTGMKTPALAANIEVPGVTVAPWRIVERAGLRLGIIGLGTSETPISSSPCAEARFLPEEAALRKAVTELETQGINTVIVLSHTGLALDKTLAARVEGVDIIVGGHSHSLLTNQVMPDNVRVDGPYPVVVKSPSGKAVPIVTARHALTLLGRLDVAIDAISGDVTRFDGDVIPLVGDDGIDPAARTFMRTYSEPLQAWINEPAGSIDAPDMTERGLIDQPGSGICRAQECRSGNLVTDLMRGVATPDAGPVDIALLNSGSIQRSFSTGTVTVGNLAAALPFDNDIYMADLPGAVLLQALEHGLSAYEDGRGRFLQVSGLKYRFDPTRPAGQRLLDAALPDGTPLSQNQRYRVVLPQFLAEGGDGYAMLKGMPWKRLTRLSDHVRSRLAAGPATTTLEGRIVRQ